MIPMTEDRFIEMVEKLMDSAKERAVEEAQHVLKSGAIDIGSYDEDSYLLPKAFVSVYADRLHSQLSIPQNKKEIANLKHFL